MNYSEIRDQIKSAIQKAHDGQDVEMQYDAFYNLFKTQQLDQSLYFDFGWLIYYMLKHVPSEQFTKRKKLLHAYLKLNLPKPSLLHSLILREAVKIEKETPLEFRIRDFMMLWGWDNIRDEDWNRFNTDGGKTASSLVEKLISVYAKEIKTDRVIPPEDFNKMVDKAIERYPDNQNMPSYKATILLALGDKTGAVTHYKKLLIKYPAKQFLWNEVADLVEDNELRIALVVKAIKAQRNEELFAKYRLKLTRLLLEKGLLQNAKYELEKYRQFYLSKGWHLNNEFRHTAATIPANVVAENTDELYTRYLPLIDDFIYCDIPRYIAIKISDKQIDDTRHPGRKLSQWTLRTKNEILRLSKPEKFGLDKRTKNGSPFEIRTLDGKVVWIKKSNSNPLEQDWIKKVEGTINIRTDRKGNPYAILEGVYISRKLLDGVSDNQNARIIALKQEDGRWSAIASTKI